jgi:hypothetical protein
MAKDNTGRLLVVGDHVALGDHRARERSPAVEQFGYYAEVIAVSDSGEEVAVQAFGRRGVLPAGSVRRLTPWSTDDGVPVTVGLRVFTNDWEWGTVVEVGGLSSISGDEAWHRVKLDSGPERSYDRSRLTTRKPW